MISILNIASVVAVSCAAVVVLAVIEGPASDRQAQMDCQTWQQEAAQYPQFFILSWQQEECASIGITIHAPLHAN